VRNPLNSRIPRDIRREAGKYAVIFLFMLAIISVVSGFLIADASLKKAYDESFEKYNIEDGYFEIEQPADDELIAGIEDGGVKLYKNYYKEVPSVGGSKIRIFKPRDEVNKICLLKGDMPESDSEIALDRLYMKSNSLSLDDMISLDSRDFKITGIVALPDYSALYENISDFMFDTEMFGVGTVTASCFDGALDTADTHYCYSWKYNEPPAESFGKEAADKSNEFLRHLSGKCELMNYVPTCRNSAIKFSGDDIGHDRVMFIVMLYMLIVIIAFVSAVTVTNTIAKEANVIGTLRASGYTKHELIRHYMAAPLIVLMTASVIGNILGYTVMKEYMAEMYLGSYSLVSYKTVWNADAFIDTTVIPFIILAVIYYVILASKLTLSPLKFLRRDLKRHQRKKAFKLNTKIPIMIRYRLRVLFQNIPGYIMIFAGMFFASIVMIFSLLFAPLLDNFDKDTEKSMLASHQYILKVPVGTAEESAERFAAGNLKIVRGDFSEGVSVYGIIHGSRYYKSEISKGKVDVSSAYADKYRLHKGDSITLHEEFGDKKYKFTIGGIYNYLSTLAVFMDIDSFNTTFEQPENSFSGYFSENEITDIDKKSIATEITLDDLRKTSRQLRRSMGNLMAVFSLLGVGVIILVVYLLSKVMIEKNTQSISVAKILGYNSSEISGIYLRTTTIVTIASMVFCMPFVTLALDAVWRSMMMEYAGWLAPVVPFSAYVKTFLLGTATYIVTALILKYKINKVPMDEALKNTE
jgi:putative ABC transport system permease protein